MSRYAVVPESQSCHCCFDFTVVDTSEPLEKHQDEEQEYEPVCECFSEDEAKLIADALNFAAPQPDQSARIAELERAMREAVEYLDSSSLNAIGSESKLHRFMRDALAKHGEAGK